MPPCVYNGLPQTFFFGTCYPFEVSKFIVLHILQEMPRDLLHHTKIYALGQYSRLTKDLLQLPIFLVWREYWVNMNVKWSLTLVKLKLQWPTTMPKTAPQNFQTDILYAHCDAEFSYKHLPNNKSLKT